MAYGVTDEGFVVKPFEVIKTEIEDALKAAFGASINLTPQSNFGQLVGIMADRETDLWDLGQAVYNSQYPDTATTDDSLDNIAAITGTVRNPPTRSVVYVTLSGTPATSVPAGTTFSVVGTGVKFATTDTVALSGGGSATGVKCESVDYGAIVAASGTLTTIETPVGGLDTVTNPLDASLGQTEETNAALRLRREQELRAQGNAAVEALRADILAVDGVFSATVFENPTDTTDGDSVPPHAVECVVLQDAGGTGADANIRDAIFASKAAGIATYGGVSGTVTDTQGFDHTIKFSRPTEKNVYVTVNLVSDSDEFPVDGVAQIKQKIVDFANGALLDAGGALVFAGYQVGDDVITSRLYIPIEQVAGIVDVTSIHIGLSASLTLSANITIGSRELAEFDTSRIVINVT